MSCFLGTLQPGGWQVRLVSRYSLEEMLERLDAPGHKDLCHGFESGNPSVTIPLEGPRSLAIADKPPERVARDPA